MRKFPTHRSGPQRGVTLIEVLVSVLIMSFGILGIVALQARAIQFSLDADDRNRAALFATTWPRRWLAALLARIVPATAG